MLFRPWLVLLLSTGVCHQGTVDRRLTVDVEGSADETLEKQATIGSFRIAEALLLILPRPRHYAGRRSTYRRIVKQLCNEESCSLSEGDDCGNGDYACMGEISSRISRLEISRGRRCGPGCHGAAEQSSNLIKPNVNQHQTDVLLYR